jgi:hypothetical protein
VLTLAFALALIAFSFARMFSLETERIWIFMTPLILIPAANEVMQIRSSKPLRVTLRVSTVMLLLFAQTWLTEILLYTWW